MSRICGLPTIDIQAAFIVDDGRRVSTAALNELPGRWFASLKSEQVGNIQFMQKILSIARYMSLLLIEERTPESTSLSPYHPCSDPAFQYTSDEACVFTSLDILHRTIGLHLLLHRYTKERAQDSETVWERGWITRSILSGVGFLEGRQGELTRLYSELTQNGKWCRSELPTKWGPGEFEMFCFLPFLSRPQGRNHSACSSVVCSAYQVEESTYKTAHVEDTCQCDFVHVPSEELVRILGQDKVPAVIITQDLDIQIVKAEKQPYVALSHVCESLRDFIIVVILIKIRGRRARKSS